MYHSETLTVLIGHTQLTKQRMTDSKPLQASVNPDPSYPTDLPLIVDCSPVQEVLEASQIELPDVLDSGLDELAKRYDWTKREVTPENAKEYSDWLRWRLSNKRKGRRGKKHYKSRRLRMRLRNYQRDKELKELQQNYRDTIYGKWIFKKKLCKQRKVEFNVTYEEYARWMKLLGNIPNTDIPYWKMTLKHPKKGLKVERIDKDKPFERDNLRFTYNEKFVCNASDLSEPNVNDGV